MLEKENKEDWKYNLKRISIEVDFLGDGKKRLMALQDILEGNIKPLEDFIFQEKQKSKKEERAKIGEYIGHIENDGNGKSMNLTQEEIITDLIKLINKDNE
jgi:hypothetical protein